MSTTKVAVVTGSNKGIGFEIVKGLCERFGGIVYLTDMDEKSGSKAVRQLNDLGLKPKFHFLDVADRKSVEAFRDHVVKEYGYIDLIINNAGIGCEIYSNTYEEIKDIININYYGLLNVAEFLYPLLREDSRVVNLSSNAGHISNLRNKYWIERLSNKNMTVSDVNEFVEAYLESEKKGTVNKEDLADNSTLAPYRVSKIGISALTVVHQRDFAGKNISMNSCHPGYVRTEMTGFQGSYSPAEGASVPLYFALDAPQDLKGCYMWNDKTVIDWYDCNSDCYLTVKYLTDI